MASNRRPAFADEISREHYGRLARCILLTGNIYDLFPLQDGQGVRFVSLESVLQGMFSHARIAGVQEKDQKGFVIITLRNDGIHFSSPDDRKYFVSLCQRLSDAERGRAVLALKNDLATFLAEMGKERTASRETIILLGELLRIMTSIRKEAGEKIYVRPMVIIIDHADFLLPAGEVLRLPTLAQETLKYFCDLLRNEEVWADPSTAVQRQDLIILLSSTAASVNARILELPKTVQIQVSLPDDDDRKFFVKASFDDASRIVRGEYPQRDIVRDSRGMTLRALDDLITVAARQKKRLSRESIMKEVNRLLKMRLGDGINILYSDHGMESIVGSSRLKKRLSWLAERIDNQKDAPAGMVFVGPNGVGKTYVAEAFAKETGRALVTLGTMRGSLFGETDAFMERLRASLASFSRVLVLVDEAHTKFGSIHDSQTHETEKRLTASILEMMDDESMRSRVVWVLATTRPDMLDPDIVRPGRCSLFVPIFDPEEEDVEEFLNWMAARFAKKNITLSADERKAVKGRNFSAGDYREFISSFIEERRFNSNIDLQQFARSWTSGSVIIPRERELQIHFAALRCSFDELLPIRFRGMPKQEIQDKIDEMQYGHAR